MPLREACGYRSSFILSNFFKVLSDRDDEDCRPVVFVIQIPAMGSTEWRYKPTVAARGHPRSVAYEIAIRPIKRLTMQIILNTFTVDAPAVVNRFVRFDIEFELQVVA